MTISKARVFDMEIPLLVPYTIAYETITSTSNLFIVLESSCGVQGVGCAAPAPEVTGETAQLARATLSTRAKQLIGAELDTAFKGRSFLVEGSPSANAAVDMALADLSARSRSLSVQELLGAQDNRPTAVTTSVTIGISSVDETLARARTLSNQGFTFLKVKGGHDIEADLSRLRAIRQEFEPSLDLALDANQGYSLKDVEAIERHQDVLSLLYLEQPTPKQDLSQLGKAAALTSIPVMADEAVRTEEDTKRIGDLGTIRLINIKLQKMGGLLPASQIDKIAAAAGMRTMLGCMDESALSIAAALHFGNAHPNVQFYDLDGHLDLSADPFDGLVSLTNGQLVAKTELGLGWTELPSDFSEL